MDSPSPPRFRSLPYLIAAAVFLGTALYGVTVYDSLPNPYPTHSDFNGPDAWGDKNVWNVFGPLLIGVGVVGMLAFLAKVTESSLKQQGWGETASAQRSRVGAELTLQLLAVASVGVACLICALSVLTWQDVHGTPIAIVGGGFVVVTFAMIGRILWLMLKRDPGLDAPGTTQALDDDPSKWTWGIIYNNPDDERVMVPKRYGVGTTINYARPAGKVFYFGTLIAVLAAIFGPIMFG